MNFVKLAVAFLVFLVSLLGIYYCHVLYFNVDVVFYSAIVDGVLAAIVSALFVYLLPWNRTFTALEKGLVVALFLAGGYIFAISVPTVLDRSLSFYILEKLQQRGGSIPYSAMEDVFKNEYMKEHHLVDIRLTEQLQSGTVAIEQGVVRLTSKGETLATASRFFRKNFLPKHRLIMGQYTDVLTDPFRSSGTQDTGNQNK